MNRAKGVIPVDPSNLENRVTPEIAAEHRMFFEIVARCTAGTTARVSQEIVAERMAELLEHVATHFHTEEAFMRSIGFPGYTPHKAEHDAIARAAFALADRFHTGGLTLSEVAEFAAKSLMAHLA